MPKTHPELKFTAAALQTTTRGHPDPAGGSIVRPNLHPAAVGIETSCLQVSPKLINVAHVED